MSLTQLDIHEGLLWLAWEWLFEELAAREGLLVVDVEAFDWAKDECMYATRVDNFDVGYLLQEMGL